MKAVIVDDEPESIRQLKYLLSRHCKQVEIVGEAIDGENGAELILTLKPDIVFLDVQMPGQSGFDMLASLGTYHFTVIFVTGFDEYAIQAIRCSALDYLLKPVDVSELVNCVSKAEMISNQASMALRIDNLANAILHPTKSNQKIALPILKGHRLVDPDQILYLKASRNYTSFFLMDGEEILISKGIYLYEELLKLFGFVRCHASYIVNIQFVERFEKEATGYKLLLVNLSDIPVTSMFVQSIKESLRIKTSIAS